MEMSELEELLAGWQGMELPPERQAHLLQRLREDRDLRQALVGEIRMVSMARTVQAAEPRWLALADELGRDPGYDSQMQLMEMGIHGKLEEEYSPIVSAWWKRAALVALVVVALLACAASWLYFQGQSGRRTVDNTATIAMAVSVEECDWEIGSDQKPILNSAVHAGRLALHRGNLSLAFLSGVTVVMKGPVEAEIQSLDKIFCRRGTLRVIVPQDAHGFTVLAPGAAIVDLGSEFVVDVRSTGETRLTVLEGKTRASVLSKDGTAAREQIVEKSESVEIDPAGFRITNVAAPQKMPDSKSPVIPPLKLSANYPSIILAAGPRGYWRCEEIADGVIANEVAGGAPLQLNGALSIVNEAGDDHSIAFAPGDITQFLGTRDDWTPPPAGCAIELCFASAAFNASALAAMIDNDNDGHRMLVELLARGQKPGDKPGGLRFVRRTPPADEGGINLYSHKLYVPQRWHHLVAQQNGALLQLYMDGEAAGETRLDGSQKTFPCRVVFGRLKDIAFPDTRGFVGHMDEIALYDRPLKPEEIKAHAKAALAK